MEEGAKNWRKGNKSERNLDETRKLYLAKRRDRLKNRKVEMVKTSDGMWLPSSLKCEGLFVINSQRTCDPQRYNEYRSCVFEHLAVSQSHVICLCLLLEHVFGVSYLYCV